MATIMGSNADAQRDVADSKERHIEDLKNNTPCFGCDNIGHWFKDRRDFTHAMNAKATHRSHKNEKGAEGLRGPVFRPGVQ